MPYLPAHSSARHRAADSDSDLHDGASSEGESDEKIAKKAEFFKSYLTDGNNKPNWRKLKEECCDASTGNFFCPYPGCSRSMDSAKAVPQDWKKTYDHVRYHFRSLGLGNLLGGRGKDGQIEERIYVRPKSPKKKAKRVPAPLPSPSRVAYKSTPTPAPAPSPSRSSQQEDEDEHVDIEMVDDSDCESDVRSVLLSDVENGGNSSGLDSSFSSDEDEAEDFPRPPTILIVNKNRKRKLEDLYQAPPEPQPLKHFRRRATSFVAVDRQTGVASIIDTDLPLLFPEAEQSCGFEAAHADALQHIFVYTVPMIY